MSRLRRHSLNFHPTLIVDLWAFELSEICLELEHSKLSGCMSQEHLCAADESGSLDYWQLRLFLAC
jgi:hypothetical protein